MLTQPTPAGGPTPLAGGFNCQFQLRQNGQPYNGTCDFEFRLYDGPHGTGATQIGPTIPDSQTITDGTSNTILLFEQPPPAPPTWDGNERWLEVRVRTPAGSANPFVPLTPWQRIGIAPYAAYALNAAALPANYGNAVNFSNAGNAFTGNGAGLTNLNAGNIATGNLATARLAGGGAWALSSDLNMDGNTLVVDAGLNSVGIGVSTPEALLHVVDGSAGTVTAHASASLALERSGANYLNMLAPDASESGVLFGRPATGSVDGAIIFNNPANASGLQFRTGGNSTKMVITAAGQIGAGTTAPSADMHVHTPSGATLLRLTSGGSWAADISQTDSSNLAISNGGAQRLKISPTGNVGIGLDSLEQPVRLLDLSGAPDIAGSVGQVRIRDEGNALRSLNIGFQNSGINAFLQTVKAPADTLFPRLSLQPNGGFVGIGTTEPGRLLTVNGDGYFVDNLGVGVPAASARLEVRSDTEIPAIFNRGSNDGTLVSFYRGASIVGSISVATGFVSYNAFTGSHYAWSEREIDRGALVRMTGDNRRMPIGDECAGGENGAEIVYGIEASAIANDPACLGAHLGRLNPGEPATEMNPRLVMAVGNGEIWVVDSGRDIEPGDLLISSDVSGCAMLDDPTRFTTGHIVGRAAERVRWSTIGADQGGDGRGRKCVRISVLFDRFTRSAAMNESIVARLARLESLGTANADLAERVRSLEALVEGLLERTTP